MNRNKGRFFDFLADIAERLVPQKKMPPTAPHMERDIPMPHPGHERHLCLLANTEYLKENFADYKNLVKNPQFVCKSCGRTAANEANLCAPEEL